MDVNSVTTLTSNPLGGGTTTGYLALNGCTNFGGHTFVSVPSSSCSSEATGESAGMVGLIESYARQLDIAPNPALTAWKPGDNVLSADEAMQIVRSTADDIDFSTPERGRSGQQLRHAQRQPDPRHGALPEHRGLGRHVRLRPRQRLRDAQGGARRTPARPRP